MASIQQIIPTNALKTNLLSEMTKHRKYPLFFRYDKELDVLMILVVPPTIETTVHYLDDHVAILNTNELEIVGLQIEDFEIEFVPMYNSLQKVWRLSDFGVKKTGGNVWDLTLAVEEKQLMVALEVVRAVEPILGQPAQKFERVLEYTS